MTDTIGTRITRLREQAGITQSELAKRLKLSRSSVQSWESGVNIPSTDNLFALSRLFHVSADYLLDISADKTVLLDKYDNSEQVMLMRLLRYFDEKKEKKD